MAERTDDRDGDCNGDRAGNAEYVFGGRVRLEPRPAGVRVEPATFETTLTTSAN